MLTLCSTTVGWVIRGCRDAAGLPRAPRLSRTWRSADAYEPVVMDPSLSLTRLITRMLWRGVGAEARGTKLLKKNLSPVQLQQYRQYRHFDVIGGQTGKRYRIRPGTSLSPRLDFL